MLPRIFSATGAFSRFVTMLFRITRFLNEEASIAGPGISVNSFFSSNTPSSRGYAVLAPRTVAPNSMTGPSPAPMELDDSNLFPRMMTLRAPKPSDQRPGDTSGSRSMAACWL